MIIIDTLLPASNLRTVAHKYYCDGYLGMHTSNATVLEGALVVVEGRATRGWRITDP